MVPHGDKRQRLSGKAGIMRGYIASQKQSLKYTSILNKY